MHKVFFQKFLTFTIGVKALIKFDNKFVHFLIIINSPLKNIFTRYHRKEINYSLLNIRSYNVKTILYFIIQFNFKYC